ncbi:MAG: glycosyltransferase family 4 protein, partial [Oceanipulchritudo sp.]
MAHYVMLTQVYPPDPAAPGQHFESAALRLASRGHRLTVYTSDRDSSDSSIRLNGSSRHPGVRVVRLPWSNFGIRSQFLRHLSQMVYLGQVFFRLLIKGGVDGVILTTNPPTVGMMYLVLRAFRRFPTLYWVMDVNPDRSIAMGHRGEDSPMVVLLDWCNGRIYRICETVVVLDRYMRQRILRKNFLRDEECGKVEIIPPWPLEKELRPVPREENTFLTAHNLENKRCIFMYSGNHSLVHPLGTLLSAIRARKNREDLSFLFVGGGEAKGGVESFIEEQRPSNVRSFPYQPLETLSFSLSAADVQIVVMGDPMVGIVHPCKIYGAMAVGKPVLYIGPLKSHLGELVSLCGFGWVVDHGEVERLEALIDEIAAMPREEREAMGARGRELIGKSYSAEILAGRFCELVEGLRTPRT